MKFIVKIFPVILSLVIFSSCNEFEMNEGGVKMSGISTTILEDFELVV